MTKENTLDATEKAMRDMFAMSALSVAHVAMMNRYGSDCPPNEIAYFSYKIADAMLEERKK